ncbi:FAD-binding protein [Pusillimonas sp. CC-YST705]|uniref:FAD-binding protein n=1 Tax=Mesopusillimonas faecipullorum TaxID=2755040 RepID=A0ABS8CC35_9BURK|nr:FAD-binding protein [Mesopusillimonas faecipullorum]MCB5363592.1 FAD-binding protein [Mesopusillimonas faecipullorum]
MSVDNVVELETDVLVIGAGGAGMSAALTASQDGSRVILADRSLIGRGGATIMAQMTVAAALGEQVPDDWRHHYVDTLKAGRGLCSEPLARLVCESGVDAIRQLQNWNVGWASVDGHLSQVQAPGHDRPRCVYVDYLNTGPAVAKTLRTQVAQEPLVRRLGDMLILDLLRENGRVVGAAALSLATGEPVVLRAPAVIIATGGLTRLYRRNSASLNMGGDGYALALRAGARLIDMEFVQFFPIGHLAPRLVGFDPIMWDPFRYKLGGRLLNGLGEEFVEKYGHAAEKEGYTVTRDAATYAILKEVEAGRGTPAGGAYLSFQHVPEETLKKAFGPIIKKLAAQGIDLTKAPIEVAPIAHYHMGGIRVELDMSTDVPGLYAAGEAVGGANGANRLSGNAITEAITFGFQAGHSAAAWAAQAEPVTAERARELAADALAQLNTPSNRPGLNVAALIARLQCLMQADVGPFRTEESLERALKELAVLRDELGEGLPGGGVQDLVRLDALDLRNMLLVAEAVTRAALSRRESRGAHQRLDYPYLGDGWEVNQSLALNAQAWQLEQLPVQRLEPAVDLSVADAAASEN